MELAKQGYSVCSKQGHLRWVMMLKDEGYNGKTIAIRLKNPTYVSGIECHKSTAKRLLLFLSRNYYHSSWINFISVWVKNAHWEWLYNGPRQDVVQHCYMTF